MDKHIAYCHFSMIIWDNIFCISQVFLFSEITKAESSYCWWFIVFTFQKTSNKIIRCVTCLIKLQTVYFTNVIFLQSRWSHPSIHDLIASILIMYGNQPDAVSTASSRRTFYSSFLLLNVIFLTWTIFTESAEVLFLSYDEFEIVLFPSEVTLFTLCFHREESNIWLCTPVYTFSTFNCSVIWQNKHIHKCSATITKFHRISWIRKWFFSHYSEICKFKGEGSFSVCLTRNQFPVFGSHFLLVSIPCPFIQGLTQILLMRAMSL